MFLDGKGQDEKEEIHQVMMQLDKDHKGIPGAKNFWAEVCCARGNVTALLTSSC